MCVEEGVAIVEREKERGCVRVRSTARSLFAVHLHDSQQNYLSSAHTMEDY